MDYLFLLGRILYGGFFLYSGIQHFIKSEMMTGYAASRGVPSPKLAVQGSGALIVLGGIGVILGAYVELALWLIVIFLVPVTFMMHAFWKTEDQNAKMADMVAFMKNAALLGATFMMMAIPEPWALSWTR